MCSLLSVYTILYHTALPANYLRRNILVTNGRENHLFILKTLVPGTISPVFPPGISDLNDIVLYLIMLEEARCF